MSPILSFISYTLLVMNWLDQSQKKSSVGCFVAKLLPPYDQGKMDFYSSWNGLIVIRFTIRLF